MNRINLFRKASRTTPLTLNSVAWGKKNFDTTSTLIFAALLIACSVAVGCSSDKPKTVSSTNESPIAQSTPPITTNQTLTPATPVQQAATKPVHKRVVHKVPATITYADKISGVSFQYPRKYSLKTGDAATELVSTSPIPTDFVQPGAVTIAAVALPESDYPDSNLAAAFFNVSVNKSLTADQCSEFSVPQPDPVSTNAPTVEAAAQVATPPISKATIGKLMIGDMELQSTETDADATTTTGPRKQASKYYHVFQNGACYEFALNVATTTPKSDPNQESSAKPINRDEVFQRLEKVLATVKIDPVQADVAMTDSASPPEVRAETKTDPQPAATENPAQ